MSNKPFIMCLITLLLIKIVANVPKDIFDKYCKNSLSVKVKPNSSDGLWQLDDGAIIFIAQDHYSYITELHKNGFPQISHGYPKQLTDIVKNKIKKAKRLQKYLFEDYIYAMINQPKQTIYLMGFNQIWFDCPQPICIDATLDAITNDDSGNLMVFRGKYYWILENGSSYQVSKARLISDHFNEVPSYLDSVTRIAHQQKTYFFKNNYLWIHSDNSNDSVIRQRISELFQNGPNSINGAMYVMTKPNQAVMFLFRGVQYWAYDMSPEKSPPYKIESGFPDFVTNIHKSFPNNIESSFVDRKSDKVVFFVRWKFFSFPVKSLLDSNVKDSDLDQDYSFVKMFGCDLNDYKKWGFNSYKSFLEEYGKRTDNFYLYKVANDAITISQNSRTGTELTTYQNYTKSTTRMTKTSTNINSNSSVKASKSEDDENGISLSIVTIGIIFIFCALLLLSILGVTTKSKTKLAKANHKKESGSRLTKPTKSLINDMPSREVRSIIIDSDELKPVKSSVFEWKSIKHKRQMKKSDKKQKDKLNNLKSSANQQNTENRHVLSQLSRRSQLPVVTSSR